MQISDRALAKRRSDVAETGWRRKDHLAALPLTTYGRLPASEQTQGIGRAMTGNATSSACPAISHHLGRDALLQCRQLLGGQRTQGPPKGGEGKC